MQFGSGKLYRAELTMNLPALAIPCSRIVRDTLMKPDALRLSRTTAKVLSHTGLDSFTWELVEIGLLAGSDQAGFAPWQSTLPSFAHII